MKKTTCILLSMLTGISINLFPTFVQAQDQLPQAQAATFILAMAQKSTKKRTAKTNSNNTNESRESHESSELNNLQNTDEDDKEPDVQTSTVTEYQCELGNKISLYNNINDNQHIALRWKKRLHRLTRVSTSTGAHRFENRRYGLLWIDIPSKGILLDLKKGQQLANECRTPEQMAQSTKS